MFSSEQHYFNKNNFLIKETFLMAKSLQIPKISIQNKKKMFDQKVGQNRDIVKIIPSPRVLSRSNVPQYN